MVNMDHTFVIKKFTNIKKYLETNNKTLEEITLDDCKEILKYPMKITKDITIHIMVHI